MGRPDISIGIIIQARMGSSRLPGKVLSLVGSHPLLAHVTGRLALLKTPVSPVVATSRLPRDNAIAKWCIKNNIVSFRGDEQDVLDRYFKCAKVFEFAHIVRLTADNPFTDMEELDRLIALHLEKNHDYTHSFGQMPLGVGAEIFSSAALERSHAEGIAPNHREHVNEYIQEHPELFNIGMLEVAPEKHAVDLRLTVDTQEDLDRAIWLAQSAGNTWLKTKEAIALCSSSA